MRALVTGGAGFIGSNAEVNVLGTLRVLEAARSAGVRKVVVSSSAAVFGELRQLPIREDHPLDPDSPYGCSKLCCERLTLGWGRRHGIEAVALRYFNVYGHHQRYDAYGNVIPIFAFRLLRGEPLRIFGDGLQTRDFVGVDDVVSANLGAARPGVSGAFNIGSGRRVSINELVRLLESASGRPARVLHEPERVGDVRDSQADITAARDAFGYEPRVDLAAGLAAYWAWAREAA